MPESANGVRGLLVSLGRARAIRAFGLLSVLSLGLLWTLSPARAENETRRERLYTTELAVVLEGARRVLLWAETHAAEPDLARFAHPLSEQYVNLSSKMLPPGKLVSVHPHVVIVVENVERALDAASQGDMNGFRQRARIVREELVTLDNVLKHLKVRLPELPR